MGTSEAAIIGGLVALATALVKIVEYFARKRNAVSPPNLSNLERTVDSLGNAIERLTDVNRGMRDTLRDVLDTMRNVDREMSNIRGDLRDDGRAASNTQALIRQSIDAVHRRLDEQDRSTNA